MVDEEIEDVPAGPTGAPVNRDARREPEVIEGEVAARETDDSKSPPYSTGAETSADPPPAAKPARGAGARGVLGGAVAGLIVSALALGAGYTLFAPKTDLSDAPNRLSALETQARQTNDAIAAEANRESAAIAALEKRISALESSAGASATRRTSRRGWRRWRPPAPETAPRAKRPNVWKLRPRICAPTSMRRRASFLTCQRASRNSNPTRQRRTRTCPAPISPPSAARVDKVEAALAALKTEARVAAEKPAAEDNAANIAIIAEVAEERLRSGAGFGPELAALQRLGVDAAALAPLEAVVNGAPTNSALAASFSAVAPHVLAAAAPAGDGQRDGSFPRPSPRPREGARTQRDGRERSPGLGLPDRGDEPARRYRWRARLFR